jgi:SET domain-containing protein
MMIIETYIAKSPIHGLGIFAAHNLPKGLIVWKIEWNFDRIYSAPVMKSLPQPIKNIMAGYASYDEERKFWLYCVDNARFFNHADKPNVLDEDLISFTARSIKQGEELTCKYSPWAKKHLLKR